MSKANLMEALRDGHITAKEFVFVFDCRIRDAYRRAWDMAVKLTKDYS